MDNIADFLSEPDKGMFVGLVEDLDGILSVIAFDGKYNDKGFIRRAKADMRRKYGVWVEQNKPDQTVEKSSRWANAVECACLAYDCLLGLRVGDETPDSIRQQAEDILGEYIVRPPEDHDSEDGLL